MKKSYAILIAILLLLPMLTVATPIKASTGHPTLAGLWTNYGITFPDFWQSQFNVSMKAGDVIIQRVDNNSANLSPPSYLAVVFNFNGTKLVDFSGSQFDLYLSKDGYSTISPTDIKYASGFSIADLNQAFSWDTNVTVNNAFLKNGVGTFWLGTVSNLDDQFNTPINAWAQVIVGPIPFDMTNDYKYIKVFDGSTSAVAVSAQTIDVWPSLQLTPTSGPGGETVTLSGVALSANTTYNLTYGIDPTATALAQVTTGTDGKFVFTWNIKDLCMDDDSSPITISLVKNGTAAVIDTVTYTEYGRVLLNVWTKAEGPSGPIGNYSYTADANVLGDLNIEGNWFNPNVPVNVIIEGTTVATFNTNGTGYFNETLTVPILGQGLHNVTLSQGACVFIFTINVIPTLILTPDHGPIGTTVTATCYGFPANTFISLYWEDESYCLYNYEEFNVANGTTGADGQFNVTVTFVVPSGPGGYHDVDAWAGYAGQFEEGDTNTANYSVVVEDNTQFFVTPMLAANPSSVAADGSLISIIGTGLMPNTPYTIDIDNQAFAMPNYFSYTYGYQWYQVGTVQFADSVVFSDDCGNLTIQLVAAGFRPGEHVVALYTSTGYASGGPGMWSWYVSGFGNYSINTYALFTVTTVGDAVIAAINSSFATQLLAMGAQITSIQNDVATIKTNTGTIQAAVSALDAKVTALQGSVATVSTNLGTLTGTVTSIQGNVATISTNVGTIKATTDSIKSFLPVDLTPVWIAVILSLIAAIASIYGIIVIRSKIAA